MKITEIILESQLDEYGNAPNDSSDPRVAGGVPNAVGNLKARRLARSQKPQAQTTTAPTTAEPAPAEPTATAEPAQEPAPKTATVSKPTRSPIDDLLDAPDQASAPKKQPQNTDSYIQKLTNIINHAGLKSNYAVGQYTNDKRDPTTGYEVNQQVWQQAKVSPNKNQINLPAYGKQSAEVYNKKGSDWYDNAGALVQDQKLLQALNAKAK